LTDRPKFDLASPEATAHCLQPQGKEPADLLRDRARHGAAAPQHASSTAQGNPGLHIELLAEDLYLRRLPFNVPYSSG
jgi:hypothetical protein